MTKRYKTSKDTYDRVFEACQGMCVLCNTTQNLELHHVDGRGRYLTDDYRNGVMLCHNCHHNIVHANLKKYRPILKEICEVIYGTIHEDNREDVL